MPMTRRLVPLLAIVSLSCSSSPATTKAPSDAAPSDSASSDAASGESNDTATTPSFAVVDAIFNEEALKGYEFDGTSSALYLTDYADACAKAKTDVPGSHALAIGLAQTDASGKASPASMIGKYSIVTTSSAATAPSAQLSEAFLDKTQ